MESTATGDSECLIKAKASTDLQDNCSVSLNACADAGGYVHKPDMSSYQFSQKTGWMNGNGDRGEGIHASDTSVAFHLQMTDSRFGETDCLATRNHQ